MDALRKKNHCNIARLKTKFLIIVSCLSFTFAANTSAHLSHTAHHAHSQHHVNMMHSKSQHRIINQTNKSNKANKSNKPNQSNTPKILSNKHHLSQIPQIHKNTKSMVTHKPVIHKIAAPTIAATAKTHTPSTRINSTNLSQSQHLPGYLLSSIEKHLLDFVRTTISTIRYTAYKLGGTKIDKSQGIYVVDCSSYVDHILKNIYPQAYNSLTSWSGTEKPTTENYYHYFINLTDRSKHWNTIDDVEELRPGDILVFRSKNKYGVETGGHVMVVMDKPINRGNTFSIRIADSAPSGHSKDTRMPHKSGIGIGTMYLKVNPNTFQPYAYAWREGARWENNVNFAMARPIDFG